MSALLQHSEATVKLRLRFFENRLKKGFIPGRRESLRKPVFRGVAALGGRGCDRVFIQKDPIGFDGGDVNLYAYVGNNVINKKDPSGLSPAVDPNDPFHRYDSPDEMAKRLKDYYKKKARKDLVRKCVDMVDKAFWKSLAFKLTVGWTILSEVYNPAALNEGEDELVKYINGTCLDCKK